MDTRLFRPFEWTMITKLLVTFGLIALLPLVIVGWYGFTVARQTVLDDQVRALTTQADSLALRLDALLVERQTDIRQLAEDAVVKTFSAAWPNVTPEMQVAAQIDLDNLVQANPYFHLARLLNRAGRVIISTGNEIGEDYSFRPYFEEALAGNVYISDISISVDSGQPVTYFSAPVRDQTGEVVAVAVLRVLAEEIWSLVEADKNQLGPDSAAVLFDEYGIRLAHASDRELLFKAVVPLDPEVEAQLLAEHRLGYEGEIASTDFPELAEGLQQVESQPHFVFPHREQDEIYHAGAARMTSKPWTVVEALPESAFLTPVDRLGWTTGLVAGAVALMALLVSALATRWIVRPVRELSAAAQRLAEGELDHPIAGFRVQWEDEIGALIQSFETMRVSLQNSYAQLEARNRRLRRLYELAVTISGNITDVTNRVVNIIAELLDVRLAAVEEIHQDKIVVLSMYDRGQIINDEEFLLWGTPWAVVQEKKDACCFVKAVEQFPDDPFLAEHGLNAYLGVPILDSIGEVLGVINAMDDRQRDFSAEDIHLLQTLARRVSVEMEKARAEAELRRRAGELEAIAEVGGLATAGGDLQASLNTLAEKIALAASFEGVVIGLYDAEKQIISFPAFFSTQSMNLLEGRKGRKAHLKDVPVLQQLLHEKRHIYFADPQNDPRIRASQRELAKQDGVQSVLTWPLLFGGELIGTLDLISTRQRSFSPEEISLLTTLAGQTATVVQNARLFAETQQHLAELNVLFELNQAMRRAQNVEEMLPIILDKSIEVMGADAGALYLLDKNGEELVCSAASERLKGVVGVRFKLGEGIIGHIAQSDQVYVTDDISADPHFKDVPELRTVVEEFNDFAGAPLRVAGELIGVMDLTCTENRAFQEEETRLLTGIADLAANAIQRASLHEQTERRLQLINALRNIDDAIIASLDLRVVMNVLLVQVTALQNVDAADVLLLNPHTLTLGYAAGRGFRSRAIEHLSLRLGEGYAGRAALERRLVHIPDLPAADPPFVRCEMAQSEGFISYFALPLIAKAKVKGVLEIFHRAPLAVDDEWIEYLESLASQAAIAIDNAALYDDLQRANVELALAYDTTLEGWARALELRDQETEGHTQRVTEKTLELARAMGVSEAELVHVHRGALLHDIGKMGIPDSILLKPGPLSEEEWEIMRQHPVFVYNMLRPIGYLRPALDIPYCHHEKWDGTGYPRGLKGEQIPLSARIFAVVDVWDALSSDRPYRDAWPEEKVLNHIREQSGKHFDPQVVEAFLEMRHVD